jgi:hypothetical protein
MAGFINQFFTDLATGPDLRDQQHAARTFVDSLYRLGPKSGALFHVFIDVNSTVAQGDPTEIGLMAKTASLPKFTIQNKILNAYNRKNIVQERINYDPLTLTFHDDSADVVRGFWQNYYKYYFRDADQTEQQFNMMHKYQKRASESWGYSPKNSTEAGNTPNYINAIRIYSLHQKRFSSYTLIRPTIINFAHGQHTQGEYNTLEHSMTINYEAVQYDSGSVNQGKVMGFQRTHYDNVPSPLTAAGGGTQSIMGPGGLIEGAGDVLTNLQSGNFGAAALTALRVGNNAKNMNLKSAASAELKQTAMNILRGQNTQSTVFVPTQGAIADGLSKAANSIPGLIKPTTGIFNNMNSQSNQVPSTNSRTII